MDFTGRIDIGSETAPYGGSLSDPNCWFVRPPYPPAPAPLAGGSTKTASTVAQLNALLPGLVPGDVVIIADGTYNNVNWDGSSGDSPNTDMPNIAGTAAAPIVFYSQTQHGARFTRSGDGRVILKPGPGNNYLEWWGINLEGDGSRPAFGAFGTTGVYLKWVDAFNSQNQPAVRWMQSDDLGLYFSDVQNSNGGQQAEGVYVGWGSNSSLYEQNGVRLIGNTIRDSSGGAFDIKPNTFDVLIEYNVLDARDDQSGGVNLNNELIQLNQTQLARTDPDDFIFRRNIVRVQRQPGTTNGDAIRTSGQVTIDRNILFAGGGTTQDAIFFFNNGNLDVEVVANNNIAFGFPNNFIGSGGSNGVKSGSNNYTSTSTLNGVGGTTNTPSSLYEGPTSGTAIDDTDGQLGGIGTGFRFDGSQGFILPGEALIDHTGTITPPGECTVTSPIDTTIDVTSPVTIAGTADTGAIVQYRIENSLSQIWNGSAFVSPTATSADWLPASEVNGAWTASQNLPEDGSVLTVTSRCC